MEYTYFLGEKYYLDDLNSKEEITENITALSPAEQAEQEEIELDEKLAYYINQYDPDNPLPAHTESDTSDKASDKS